MPFPPHRLEPGPLRAIRVAGDAAQTRTDCWFHRVEHTLPAIQACRARTALFRVVEFLSARPWHRDLYNSARDAAQDPTADGASLRRSLEDLAEWAAAGRAPEVHAFARGELNAEYII
jgi:hypothetical protein